MGIVNICRKATLRQSRAHVRRRSGIATARIARELGVSDRTIRSALRVPFAAAKRIRQRLAYRARLQPAAPPQPVTAVTSPNAAAAIEQPKPAPYVEHPRTEIFAQYAQYPQFT